jgi:hypothetical protein
VGPEPNLWSSSTLSSIRHFAPLTFFHKLFYYLVTPPVPLTIQTKKQTKWQLPQFTESVNGLFYWKTLSTGEDYIERNSGTEHSLNGTDRIIKVLGEEHVLGSLCPPKFPQELLLIWTRASGLRYRRLTIRVMITGGAGAGCSNIRWHWLLAMVYWTTLPVANSVGDRWTKWCVEHWWTERKDKEKKQELKKK